MRLLAKIFVPVLGLALLSFIAKAQDVDYTQYYLNNAGTNPGYTGTEEFLDMKLGFREGWNNFGIRNNYLFVSAYTSLNNSRRGVLRQNGMRLSDPTKLTQMQLDRRVRRKHGVGGMVTSRKLGPYALVAANANYAYHLPLGRKSNLAFGTKLGIQNQRIDFSGFTVRDDVNDLFFQSLMKTSEGNQTVFRVDFGTVLYTDKFNIGVSTGNLVQSEVSGEHLVDQTGLRYFTVQSSLLSLRVGKDLVLTPGFRAVYMENYDLAWSLNARARYKDFIYLGAGYSGQGSKLSILAGLNLANGISVNYSYDKYLGELNNFNVNVHEVIVGVTLFNKYGAPTRFW